MAKTFLTFEVGLKLQDARTIKEGIAKKQRLNGEAEWLNIPAQDRVFPLRDFIWGDHFEGYPSVTTIVTPRSGTDIEFKLSKRHPEDQRGRYFHKEGQVFLKCRLDVSHTFTQQEQNALFVMLRDADPNKQIYLTHLKTLLHHKTEIQISSIKWDVSMMRDNPEKMEVEAILLDNSEVKEADECVWMVLTTPINDYNYEALKEIAHRPEIRDVNKNGDVPAGTLRIGSIVHTEGLSYALTQHSGYSQERKVPRVEYQFTFYKKAGRRIDANDCILEWHIDLSGLPQEELQDFKNRMVLLPANLTGTFLTDNIFPEGLLDPTENYQVFDVETKEVSPSPSTKEHRLVRVRSKFNPNLANRKPKMIPMEDQIREKMQKLAPNSIYLEWGSGELTNASGDALLAVFQVQGQVENPETRIVEKIAEYAEPFFTHDLPLTKGFGIMEMLLEDFPEVVTASLCWHVEMFCANLLRKKAEEEDLRRIMEEEKIAREHREEWVDLAIKADNVKVKRTNFTGRASNAYRGTSEDYFE